MAETEEKKNKEAAAAEEAAEKAAEGKTEEKKKEEKPKFPPPPAKVEGFVHPHVHTEYSLLYGAAPPVSFKKSPLPDAVWKNGMLATWIPAPGN